MYTALCYGHSIPKARTAVVRRIRDPDDSSKTLDGSALVLFFPAPRTATGEDILELHVHGGQAIVSSILDAIRRLAAHELPIRYAEPGEFTRRAFYNNRIDLTQVEALGDSLNAVTEEQRRLSVQGTRGKLGQGYDEWRQMLLYARGELEALIDFSEDQHFDESSTDLLKDVASRIWTLRQRIECHRENAMRGELLRNGITIALIGTPNVGKSSILNGIIGRNAAIVSPKAGTTRDVVEIGVDLGGFLCRFGDTAGLRKAAIKEAEAGMPAEVDEIEREGIRRARAQADQSDLVIVVLSISKSSTPSHSLIELDPEIVATANQLAAIGKHVVIAINKMDLCGTVTKVVVPPDTNGSTGTSFEVTREIELKAALQHAIPSVLAKNVHLISCTHAQTLPKTNPQIDSLKSTDVIAHAAEISQDVDPGNFHSFTSGLIGAFRDLTRALQARDSDRHNIANNDSHSDPTKAAIDGDDLSIWEESLSTTTRQRQLLDTCQTELDHFLDMVPGARPPAVSRPCARGPLQNALPMHGADLVPRAAPTSVAEADPGLRLKQHHMPAISRDNKQSLAPHDQSHGGDAANPITTADTHTGTGIARRAKQLNPADPDATFSRPQIGSFPPVSATAIRTTKAEAQAAAAGPTAAEALPLIDADLTDLQDGDQARARSRGGPTPPRGSRHTHGATSPRPTIKPNPTDPPAPLQTNPLDDWGVSSPVSGDHSGPRNTVDSEDDEIDVVTAAEHLRAAAAALGKITGRGAEVGDVEEVLGVVFEKSVLPFLLFTPGFRCVRFVHYLQSSCLRCAG